MTFSEAQSESEKYSQPDEDGDAQIPVFVRTGREGLVLHEHPIGSYFWLPLLRLVGHTPEEEKVPFTKEDFHADDWEVFPYYI